MCIFSSCFEHCENEGINTLVVLHRLLTCRCLLSLVLGVGGGGGGGGGRGAAAGGGGGGGGAIDIVASSAAQGTIKVDGRFGGHSVSMDSWSGIIAGTDGTGRVTFDLSPLTFPGGSLHFRMFYVFHFLLLHFYFFFLIL